MIDFVKLFRNKYLLITVIFFGSVYSLISLVNHYNFRTYALDLGAYTNALYDYRHLQWSDSSSFNEITENLLADHFDLYLIIFSPLSLIFKSYTLLIIQILFILLGGIGIFKYFSNIKPSSSIPLLATICFYLFFGIFSAVSYDYHSNVVAAMIIPWFFYYFKEKKYVASFFLLIFLFISKENVSLWVAFICLGLLFEFKNDKTSVRYLLLFFSLSIAYFILVIEFIMPSLSRNGVYHHFNYSSIGDSPFTALKYLISHPIDSIKTMFINHTNNHFGNYVKLESHMFILISGLYMLFFKPHFLIMLIPIYFQKMFNDNNSMWSIDAQYSIEFAPILIIGAFSVISKIKNIQWANMTSVLVIVGCLITTIRLMDHTVFFTDKARIRIYKSAHYLRNYSVSFVHQQLKKIPENAIVSAQSPFLPHLALRDKIYQFPIIKDAEYIVYSPKEGTYPISKDEFNTQVKTIMRTNKWQIQFSNNDLVILKRCLP
jgi:uncharacterized membrane protein